MKEYWYILILQLVAWGNLYYCCDMSSAEDEYDPHEHRQLANPTNNKESLGLLLKCGLGTGILAMPQAFSKTGLITGIVGTIFVGILTTHCLRILILSQYAACKHKRVPHLSYPESASVAMTMGPRLLQRFARPIAPCVVTFIVLYQLGVCCVYIVFIADSTKKALDPLYEMSLEFHMLILLGPLIALNLIRSLKILAPLSALANVLILFGICFVFYFLLTGEKSKEPLDLWGSAATFPLFLGTILFAMTAVGVVVAVENNMKTPKDFISPCGILNTGMSIIVILYVGVGVVGYIFCVSKCSDSITLNLPKDNVLAVVVVVMFALAIFITYSLHCYVPVEMLWQMYLLPRVQKSCPQRVVHWEYVLRVGLCLLTFVVAVGVPRLGLFISFFGALCLSALGMCFPAMMEACVNYPKPPSFSRQMLFVKDVLIFIFGILGLVSGSYVALEGIVRSFEPEKNHTVVKD